jgi:hypothetical protein
MTPKKSIPYGFCQCGCGQKTKLSRDNDASRGRIKGTPMAYCLGHNRRTYRPQLQRGFIPLDEVVYTRVSPEDYDDLAQFTWILNAQGYAVRLTQVGSSELLHRRVMRAKRGQYVDHIDGNRLNNERWNLRICTNSQNCMNRGPQSNSKHGYKGVCWSRASRKWRAYIKVNGKQIHLGLFATIREAAMTYNASVQHYHGEFAVLNEVPDEA